MGGNQSLENKMFSATINLHGPSHCAGQFFEYKINLKFLPDLKLKLDIDQCEGSEYHTNKSEIHYDGVYQNITDNQQNLSLKKKVIYDKYEETKNKEENCHISLNFKS